MAHLPVDTLPSKFDVVVEGTGLTQSIAAAALARAGKAVLHIDSNSFYGDHWGTLMHKDLEQWLAEQTSEQTAEFANEKNSEVELEEAEQLINFTQSTPNNAVYNVLVTVQKEEDNETKKGNAETEKPSEQATERPEDDTTAASSEEEQPSIEEQPSQQPVAGDEEEENGDSKITWSSLESKRRRFNYDIMPKLLYCRGTMVDTITQCGVARYLEFKAVSKLFAFSGDRLLQVPCSRSDVFSSKIVSMLEKRKMMKFLTFCAEYDQHPEEYEEFKQKPFGQFLSHRDLTPNLIQFIVYSIAMVEEDTPTVEGLRSCQTFMHSLGRFGNAPFLYPIFGSGELPQAFCRLCAVFGGVYCLRLSVQSIVVTGGHDDTRCTGVVCSNGQKISCSTFIGAASRLREPLHLEDDVKDVKFSRAIFITDGPINGTGSEVTLLTFPPCSVNPQQTNTVMVLQMEYSSFNTPEGAFMVHLRCKSYSQSAQEDLEMVARKLFKIQDIQESCSDGPNVLWSVYFNRTSSFINQSSTLHKPPNVHIVSDPDGTIGFEQAVNEAKEIFKRVCPDEDFLPPMPDAEDIIYTTDEVETEEPETKTTEEETKTTEEETKTTEKETETKTTEDKTETKTTEEETETKTTEEETETKTSEGTNDQLNNVPTTD